MEEERATAARPPRLLSLGKFGEGRSEEGQDLEDQEKNDGGRRHTDLSAGRSSKVARAIGYRQFAGEEIHPPLSKPGFVTRPRGPNDDTDTKKGFASCAAAAAAARVGAEGAVSRCTPSLLLLSILAWCLVGSVSAAGLEATLIAVDLSGFMVNADYPPSRLQCQYECVNLITTVKMQNPESAVGLMSMSCRDEECPRVHIAPAMDSEQHDVLNKLHALNRHPANRVQFEKAMEVSMERDTRTFDVDAVAEDAFTAYCGYRASFDVHMFWCFLPRVYSICAECSAPEQAGLCTTNLPIPALLCSNLPPGSNPLTAHKNTPSCLIDALSSAVSSHAWIKVGFMCLKNRANKNQSPRIIAIVGSPLKIKNPDEMFKLGKALRKHNVAVDVISFGESAELNTPFLDRSEHSTHANKGHILVHAYMLTCRQTDRQTDRQT
jgi:hypothetical protein